LNFNVSESNPSSTAVVSGHAKGTGMGLLPVSTQVLLMHRRCNHVSASLLYHAIDKKLTSGLCAKKPSASLCNFSVIDCLACTLAKSKVAAHRTRNMELLSVGKERQRVPGHITPRGLHSGVAPYEFLALDLKTDLPNTRNGCTICMIIVCLYSMRRHTVALVHKSDELEALQDFILKVVDGQGFRTRRIRVDISGEQTSNLMVNYLASKGIEKQQVPHAHSPQSNPAERQLQTFFRRILVIKLAAQLPNWLLDELAEAVNNVDAALPVRDNPGGASPIAMITGTRPSASY